MAEKIRFFKEELTLGAYGIVQAIIPEQKLVFDRISIWILTFGEDVTVRLRAQMEEDTPLLDGATGKTASPGTTFTFTTEDVFPGDVLVEVEAGPVPPSKVLVLAVGWNRQRVS